MPRLLQFVFCTVFFAAAAAGAQTISIVQGVVLASGATKSHSLRVYVDELSEAPALIGESSLSGDELRFEPRYPLASGMRYRAELHLEGSEPVIHVFELPAAQAGVRARVEAIYPSGDVLPENLLRIYLHFSAPMSRGNAYSHISLIDDVTQESVELPFLELEQELWDPAGQRLTVLFDPGRIKRGLVPNVEAGLPLVPGRSYRFRVSENWLAADQRPLAEPFEKRFSVVPADYDSPKPSDWKIQAPAAGGKDPVVVTFNAAVDQALALRLIDIIATGQTVVSGESSLTANETRWLFTPQAPWRTGRYRIRIESTLEDPSGNSVLRPFETLPDARQAAAVPAVVYLNFEVQ